MPKFIARLLFGILIWGLLVWKIGPPAIFESLSQFKILALILINMTTLSGFFLGGGGIIILGKSVSPQLEWRQAFKGFLASSSFALFVPGRVGDLTLPFYWKRFMQYGECLSIVFTDKMITLFWVLVLGSCGIYAVFHNYAGFVISGSGIIFIFALFLFFSIPKTRMVVSKVLPGRILDFLQGSVNAFRTLRNRGKTNLLIAFTLTGIRIFIYGLGFWISLWGVGVSSPFFYTIFLMAISQFVSFIPISIMGLGTVEAVCVYGLDQMGIKSSPVIAALLAGRMITLFWLSLFFFMFSLKSGVAKTELIKDTLKNS